METSPATWQAECSRPPDRDLSQSLLPPGGSSEIAKQCFLSSSFGNLVKSLTPQSYYVTIYLIVNIMCDYDNSRKSFPPGQIQLDRFPEGNQAFDIFIEKILNNFVNCTLKTLFVI